MKFLLMILLKLFLAATVFSLEKATLTVAVAANLTFVMDELKADFRESNPDAEITIISGSSGKLTAQILAGAPFDLFLSADMDFPVKIKKEGFAVDDPVVFAAGKLILFTVKVNDLKKGLVLLKEDNVQKIAIASPAVAPHGKATVEALRNAGILSFIISKFVYAENIVQTAQMTVKAADAGFIALSVLFDPAFKDYRKEGVNWIEVDPKLCNRLNQGMVILLHGRDNPLSKHFFDYMLSDRAKGILRKNGYQ